MTRADLHNIATVGDIERLRKELLAEIQEMISESSIKEFYTPKEFAEVTGLKYSTVVNYCNTGKLAATQLSASGSWLIPRSEIDRLQDSSKEELF